VKFLDKPAAKVVEGARSQENKNDFLSMVQQCDFELIKMQGGLLWKKAEALMDIDG
jgi:hypothetical protein